MSRSFENALTMITIGTIDAKQSNSYVDLVISGVPTSLLLDIKALTSVLNRSALRKLPPRVKVTTSKTRLKEFGANLIPVAGTISVPVDYRGQILDAVRFYIVDSGVCVLRQDLFDRLGFCIVDRAAKRIHAFEDLEVPVKITTDTKSSTRS